MIRGRDTFNKFKPIINFLTLMCGFLPFGLRVVMLDHFRMVQGNLGLLSRYVLLQTIAKKCGENVSIQPNVFLLNVQNLSVGDNVSIHPMCYIDATGGIEIGHDVSIAHGVTILSTTHDYHNPDIPIKDQGINLSPTKISNNVWVGAKATILCGKNIGTSSVIAANCVITKDVAPNTVIGGIPNKFNKNEGKNKGV